MSEAPGSTIVPSSAHDIVSSTRRPPRWWMLVIAIVVALAVVMCFLAPGMGGRRDRNTGLADGVRSNRIQAVTLTSDIVYFGRLKQTDADWFVLEGAYFLRSVPDTKDSSKSSTQVVSVKQQAGGDGDLVLNAREVLLVQNLTANSQIATTIEDAER